jgi:hypothetical protein
MQIRRKIYLLFALLILQSCAVTSREPSDLITGTWRSTLAGFTITTIYTPTKVTVDRHKALNYQLDGDKLTIDDDQASLRLVRFLSNSVMIQVDVITGTEHRFERATNAS